MVSHTWFESNASQIAKKRLVATEINLQKISFGSHQKVVNHSDLIAKNSQYYQSYRPLP